MPDVGIIWKMIRFRLVDTSELWKISIWRSIDPQAITNTGEPAAEYTHQFHHKQKLSDAGITFP